VAHDTTARSTGATAAKDSSTVGQTKLGQDLSAETVTHSKRLEMATRLCRLQRKRGDEPSARRRPENPHRHRTAILVEKRNARRLRGDLELYDGAGSRYAITITDTGIYWYEGLVLGSVFLDFEEFTTVAEGLNNADGMHTYRLAVRDDRIVQIYRDAKLMGLRRYEYRTPRDAYIQFGAGQGVEALVGCVAFDLSGAFQP
jgi:hypothetical protein